MTGANAMSHPLNLHNLQIRLKKSCFLFVPFAPRTDSSCASCRPNIGSNFHQTGERVVCHMDRLRTARELSRPYPSFTNGVCGMPIVRPLSRLAYSLRLRSAARLSNCIARPYLSRVTPLLSIWYFMSDSLGGLESGASFRFNSMQPVIV